MTVEVQKSAESANKVLVEDSRLIIQNLVVDDHDVVQYIALAKAPEQAIVEALRLGVRILRIARTSGDVEMVKREFDAMITGISTNVEKVLTEAKEAVGKRLTEFTSEELQKSLREHKDGLQAELTRLFGPESAVSVQKQIDKMLELQVQHHVQGLAKVLEQTDDPENPFFKLRKELKEAADKAVKEVHELRDEVFKAKGVASEREKGTEKGREYQDYVFEEVERIAGIFGDTAENVADQPGEKGKAKAGDVLVTLNTRDTGGAEVRFVFEAKNRKVTGPSALSELDEAKENRMAVAAVAVFSSAEYVPSTVRSWRDYSGHRYVCVWQEDGADPSQLEFTYRCARVDALQSIELAKSQLDFAAIGSQLKRLRSRLNELQQMRTKLGGAKDVIGEVQALIEKHQDAMRADLKELDSLLNVAN